MFGDCEQCLLRRLATTRRLKKRIAAGPLETHRLNRRAFGSLIRNQDIGEIGGKIGGHKCGLTHDTEDDSGP